MLVFDPNDPFPNGSPFTYAEAKAHAVLADAWLGLEVEKVERALIEKEARSGNAKNNQQLWIGLSPEKLLTPYVELREMLEQLQPRPGETVVDLGAAYGRLGFVIDRYFKGTRFLGYEFVPERVAEGCRVLPPSSELVQADLFASDFRPRVAHYYFVYDYGSRAAIEKTLDDLREISREQAITVVGRGRASRDAIERRAPWLSQVVAPEHGAHFSIYRTQERA